MNAYRMSRIKAPATAAALILAAACSGTEDTPRDTSVSDETYVAVMVELLLLEAEPVRRPTPDARVAALDSMRAEVLETHGVTAGEVLAFADSEGGDPARMQVLWEQVTEVYDSVRLVRLRAKSEAESEAEGKLGADAVRSVAADSTRDEPDSVTARRGRDLDPERLDSLLKARRRFDRGPGTTPD